MTKRLAEILNIDENAETDQNSVTSQPASMHEKTPVDVVKLQEKLQEIDKISQALPMVDGLGLTSDTEYDTLANKAEKAFDDLMDLGMNVEPKYSSRMFEVAGTMINAAIAAKNAKIDKKLKMVDLQLKKLASDRKHANQDENEVTGEGYILTDRNSIMERIKNMKN
jgi:hypothetical protein